MCGKEPSSAPFNVQAQIGNISLKRICPHPRQEVIASKAHHFGLDGAKGITPVFKKNQDSLYNKN